MAIPFNRPHSVLFQSIHNVYSYIHIQQWILYFEIGEDLEPRHAGLVTAKGPSDKLPFMVGFFNTLNDDVPLSAARSRRSAAGLSSYWDQPTASWDTRAQSEYYINHFHYYLIENTSISCQSNSCLPSNTRRE